MPDPVPLRAAAGETSWPAAPDRAAYHGLAGELVRVLDPATEADPIGVLASLLAGVGNALGTGPHLILDHARHALNVWPVLVGPTGTGRKGTALAAAGVALAQALPAWWSRQAGGLASGEGLIFNVRDAVAARVPVKARGVAVPRYEAVETDPGVADKRLFVVETEFGSVLAQVAREGSTLSMVVRNAWDGKVLSSMVKHSPIRATGAHITITGHITAEEVRDLLSQRDLTNGFANRFIWLCVRRSKLLPFGGDHDAGRIEALAEVLRETVAEASAFGRLTLDVEARESWARVYADLTGDGAPGIGHLVNRAAPQVLRLAGVYAALDATPIIGRRHLLAALALWGYAEASIRHVFGADAAATQTRRRAGTVRRTILITLLGGALPTTAIADIFHRNLPPGELRACLEQCVEDGVVGHAVERPAGGRGRPVEVWSLTDAGREEALS